MTIFAWIGALISLCASVWLASLAISYAFYQFRQLYTQLSYKTEALTRREVGKRLMVEAYWYSEDEAVMAALEGIGRKLSEDGYYNISDVRDEWRRRKGKPKDGSDQKS